MQKLINIVIKHSYQNTSFLITGQVYMSVCVITTWRARNNNNNNKTKLSLGFQVSVSGSGFFGKELQFVKREKKIVKLLMQYVVQGMAGCVARSLLPDHTWF